MCIAIWVLYYIFYLEYMIVVIYTFYNNVLYIINVGTQIRGVIGIFQIGYYLTMHTAAWTYCC